MKWFAPNTINDNIFRVRSTRVPSTSTDQFTGMITAAAPFSERYGFFFTMQLFMLLEASGGKNFMIVGCAGGVYVGIRGEFSKNYIKFDS